MRESLERCRELMDRHVPDCLVRGYEPLVPTLSLPDPNDRHVLAAAVHGGVSVVVTFNLGDFPDSVLSRYNIEAVHPDEFVIRLVDESSESVLDAVQRHRAALKRPPKSASEYLATLEQCRLTETAARLKSHDDEI